MKKHPQRPIKLYRHPLSGHSHRVELMLSVLDLATELIDVDLMKGEHKRPEFLTLNPLGQVPVVDDAGTIVADSNAILVYLARKYGDTQWLPVEPAGEAAVQRWLSVAAGPIAFGPAAARLVTVFGAKYDAAEVIARAHGILRAMDAQLGRTPFLAGSHATIADLACYAYVAHAPEGNVSLSDYPHIRNWLARIEALSGFVPMKSTAIGLAAA